MLSSLKFVQGAVARKDYVPALTHFRIKDGFVKGFNGGIGLCHPISIDLDISPKGIDFVKAISACEETIALSMAPNGKLVVRSGNFKTLVECDDPKNFPNVEPEGEFVKITDPLLPALQHLEPFVAEDASRPWACGVLLDNGSAYATNNIVLLQYWLGYEFPVRLNIPSNAVRELLRIGEEPTHLQVTETRMVFHYENGSWLSTQVLTQAWPDVDSLLAKAGNPDMETFTTVTEGFWLGLEQLAPFTDKTNRCYMMGDRISTMPNDEASGTSVKVTEAPESGCYNAKQLLRLKGVANCFDFASYPRPVTFYGDKVRGILVGIAV